MRYSSLAQWLQWQETLHPKEMELGLERVAHVWRTLHTPAQLPFVVITVAGTNGKGSTVAFLEAMLKAAGYRVGCFTSPHLVRYNERIRLNGREAEDELICSAFERIDRARGEISLTYFEFSALAALTLFTDAELDVAVLEVGLGGRLDATNIVDADLALITTIGLDHTAWLGDTLEEIAAEKAGIMRRGRPAVYAGKELPAAISTQARALSAPLFCAGSAYRFELSGEHWRWHADAAEYRALPMPGMRASYQLRNAAGAIMAMQLLQPRLAVSASAIAHGLVEAQLKGRFQIVRHRPFTVLDVAHNGQAAQQLCDNLQHQHRSGASHAIFGIMADKDVAAVVLPMRSQIDRWHLVDLEVPRAMPPEKLRDQLIDMGVESEQITLYANVANAWSVVPGLLLPEDRLITFGSFWLIGDVIRLLDSSE